MHGTCQSTNPTSRRQRQEFKQALLESQRDSGGLKAVLQQQKQLAELTGGVDKGPTPQSGPTYVVASRRRLARFLHNC